MFSKRHYEFLAQFFAYEIEIAQSVADEKFGGQTQQLLSENRVQVLQGTARLLAAKLVNDNPKFKRDKFLKACGIKEGA